MLLVLVSTPYLQQKDFFSIQHLFVIFCLVNHLITNVVFQFHKLISIIMFCNLYCSGELLTSEEFKTSRTLAQCAPSVAKA